MHGAPVAARGELQTLKSKSGSDREGPRIEVPAQCGINVSYTLSHKHEDVYVQTSRLVLKFIR